MNKGVRHNPKKIRAIVDQAVITVLRHGPITLRDLGPAVRRVIRATVDSGGAEPFRLTIVMIYEALLRVASSIAGATITDDDLADPEALIRMGVHEISHGPRYLVHPEPSERISSRKIYSGTTHAPFFTIDHAHATLDQHPYEETVFYVTDREMLKRKDGTVRYSDSGLPAKTPHYGQCLVTLPLKHRTGMIESPRSGEENPARHVQVRTIRQFGDANEFHQVLTSQLALAKKHDVMLFVHGFATSFTSAMKRTAQLRFDTNFPGIAMAYSWPSMGNIKTYGADYDRVDGAATRLEHIVSELLHSMPIEARVHVLGHSLGCLIVANAIKRLNPDTRAGIGEIILAAPDISSLDYPYLADALRSHARRVTVYTAPADRALQLSAGIRNKIARVGSGIAYALHSGVEAIDASETVRKSFFGDRHGYIFEAPLIAELRAVLDGDPQLRARLERRRSGKEEYYVIRP